MDHASRRGEVCIAPPRSIIREWNANLEVRTDGHVEACQESRAAAAKIFTGGIFLKGGAARVASAHVHGQVNFNSTFRALPRSRPAAWAHRQDPHFCRPPPGWGQPKRPLGPRKNSRRSREFRDRKSTRLNSSHGYISYAVFCLKT